MSQRPILITAVGSAGDLHPHLGLAKALQQRGHRVSVLTSPNYRDAVENAGVDYVGCGSLELLATVLVDRRVWHPKKGFAGIWPMINDMMRHALRYIETQREQQPLLIGSPLAFGPRLAAEKYRLPFVATQLAPSVFMSAYDPPRYKDTAFVDWLSPKWRRKFFALVEDQYIDRICQPDLNGLRERIGLPPVCNVLSGWANHGDLVLCLFPDWFAAPQPDWPGKSRLVGFPLYDESGQHELDAELQQFLARPEPLVLFCPGSAMAQAEGVPVVFGTDLLGHMHARQNSEFLLRAATAGELGSINLAVDLCNVVSLHSGLPISVVDRDRVSAPLHLGIAPAGAASGARANSAGVTRLTRASVVWADSATAHRSWNGSP